MWGDSISLLIFGLISGEYFYPGVCRSKYRTWKTRFQVYI